MQSIVAISHHSLFCGLCSVCKPVRALIDCGANKEKEGSKRRQEQKIKWNSLSSAAILVARKARKARMISRINTWTV
jgi:hypothetical protein